MAHAMLPSQLPEAQLNFGVKDMVIIEDMAKDVVTESIVTTGPVQTIPMSM